MTECSFQNGKDGYHFTECGLDYVYLLNGYDLEDDPQYGEMFSLHDSDSLHQAIAKNIVLHRKDLEPQDMRFLRKELRMSQNDLAESIGKNLRTYQRYEQDGNSVPEAVQNLVRIFYWDFHMKKPSVMEFIKELQAQGERKHELYMQLMSKDDGWRVAA